MHCNPGCTAGVLVFSHAHAVLHETWACAVLHDILLIEEHAWDSNCRGTVHVRGDRVFEHCERDQC